MKYFVRIGEAEHEVTIEGERVTFDGVEATGHVVDVEMTPIRMVTIGNEVHRVVARRGAQRGAYTLWLDGFRFELEALDERARAIRELSGNATAASGPAPLVAPMPGLIVRVNVSVGDVVQAGQGLVVMEAMKMENELRAIAGGTVKRVAVSAGTAVEKGALLLELE